jgi:hypothetical protein
MEIIAEIIGLKYPSGYLLILTNEYDSTHRQSAADCLKTFRVFIDSDIIQKLDI